MRSLAVARHRLLTNVRTAGWVFAVSIIAAVLPMLMTGIDPIGPLAILMPETAFLSYADRVLALVARVLEGAYILHFIILAAACNAFGSRKRRESSVAMADLMDTVPITPATRFWGDALGVFVSGMVVHLVTLPLLAFIFAVSPLPTSTFLWLELAVLALLILESAAASWKFHASRIAPATARAASSAAIFLILVFLIIVSLTRWSDFRDAWAYFTAWPSPRAWSAMVATINSPSLLVAGIVALYLAFITFYYFRGVRALERA